MFTWTDERVELLRAEWKKGTSTGAIASQLDPKLSRNAVIGKLNRLGLMGGRVSKPRQVRSFKIARAAVRQATPKPQRPAVEHLVGFDKIVASFNASADTGVSIVDLDMVHGCRWPFTCDDGETRYCNARATDGSWCAEHGARVFAGAWRPKVSLLDGFRPRTRGMGEVRA